MGHWQWYDTLLLSSLTSTADIPPAIGPQVFLSWDAPRYLIAFSTHMGCYVLLVLIIVYLYWHLTTENKRRDDLMAAGVEEANSNKAVQGFDDLTDKQNLAFRYVF